jgi:hypothetical protein
MGDIHDIEVFLSALTDFSEGAGEAFDPNPVKHFYEQRYTELVGAFMEDKGELLSFWRASSEQLFPWENKKEGVDKLVE